MPSAFVVPLAILGALTLASSVLLLAWVVSIWASEKADQVRWNASRRTPRIDVRDRRFTAFEPSEDEAAGC